MKIGFPVTFKKAKYPLENQKLILIEKNSENNFKKEELFDVKFVPLLNNNNGN